MATESLTDSLRETLAVFEESGVPRTTPEVADRLDLGRRSTYNRLERLVEHGRLETKKVGANARVWWRPSGTAGGTVPDWSAAAESLVDDVLDDVEVGIFVLDENFDVAWINSAAERYFGLDRERVLGRDTRRLVDEHVAPVVEDADAFAETVLATYDDDTYTERFECRVTAGDGREARWLEHRSEPIEAGEYAGGRVELYYDVTDREGPERTLERERALEASERRYRTLVEHFPNGAVALVDEDLRYRTVGGDPLDAADVTAEEVEGRPVEEILPPGLADELLSSYEAALDGDSSTFEAESDGLVYRFRVVPVRDGDGDVFAALGMSQDITEHVATKRRLAESEHRYRTLVEHFPKGAVGMFDRDLTYDVVGGELLEDFGLSPDELVDATISGHCRDAIADRIEPNSRAAFDGESNAFEIDLGDRHLSAHTVPVRNDGGEVDAGMLVVRDVTERKQRERELQRQASLLDSLFEQIPINLYVKDEECRHVRTSTPYLREEYPDDEEYFRGKTDLEVYSPELAEETHADDMRVIESGEPIIEKEEFDPTDGEWLLTSKVPWRDQDGEIRGLIGASQYITDRIERERELERQREQLTALDNLNDIVREITEAIIEQSTREEIEATVCERLAESDSYEFAWIAEVDPQTTSLDPHVEAGVDGYLEEVSISMDPEEASGRGPGGRAVRTREIQTAQDVMTDPDFEPWREHARAHGYRSAAAIPIVHDDALYGLLGVYADRPNAFERREQEVIGQLGEVVGHAIAAIERKQALTSDEITELEFTVPDFSDVAGIDTGVDGPITLDRAVPTGDGTYLEYGTVDVDAIDALEALADRLSHFEELTILDRGADAARFELHLSEPPVVSVVASHGGYLDRATIEDGDFHLTVHLPVTVDARRIVDAVQDAYPTADLLRRRSITRGDDALPRVHQTAAAGLTDRQRATLEAAYHAGFFEWPREATGNDVAESLGIAPATFSQHLRKGQKQVFGSLFSTSTRA